MEENRNDGMQQNEVNGMPQNAVNGMQQPMGVEQTTASGTGEAVSGGWKGIFKTLNQKVVIGVAAAVAVVLIGCGIAAAAAANAPMNLISKGMKNTIETVGKNAWIAGVQELLNGGSVSINLNTKGITDGEIDMDLSTKIYSDLQNKKSAFQADASMDGTSFVDATVWANEKAIVISSEELLKEAYGINVKDFKENFKESALSELLGMDEEDLELLVSEQTPELSEKLVNNFSADLKALSKKIAEKLAKSVKENAEIVKEKEVLKFKEEEVKTTAIAIQLDAKTLTIIMEDVITYLEESKDLKTFLEDYAEYFASYYSTYDQTVNGEFYEYYEIEPTQINAEELIEMVYDSLDELKSEIEYFEEEYEDLELLITTHIAGSKHLVGMAFEVDDGEDKMEFSIQAGPTLEDLKELRIVRKDDYSKLTAIYTVEENDNKVYSSKLKVRLDSKVIGEGKIEWDKKDGDLDLSFTGESSRDEYALSGNLEVASDVTNFKIETLTLEGEELELDAEFVLDRSDRIPSTPKYEDLVTMSEDDLLDLYDDFTGEIADLYFMFR